MPRQSTKKTTASNAENGLKKEMNLELPERMTRSGKKLDVDPSKRGNKRKAEELEEVKEEITPIYRKAIDRKRKAVARDREEPNYFEKKKLQTKKPQAKRRKIAPRAEIVEEGKWNDWKEIFLVGTELRALDEAYNHTDWDFSHLRDQIENPNSEIRAGRYLYLFGITEPQAIPANSTRIVPVPVIIAVVGDVPPPSKIGITSVQMAAEKIVDMEDMKMKWVPYVPRDARGDNLRRREGTNIYMLHCNLRRSVLKNMKEEEIKQYDYCLPYFFRPSTYLDMGEDDNTKIELFYPINGKGYLINFDWCNDSLNDTVQDFCEDNGIDYDKEGEKLKNAIREAVKEAKEKKKLAREQRQKLLDSTPQEVKDGLEAMRFYKFYPCNKDPNLLSQEPSPNINRYYGRATKVFK